MRNACPRIALDDGERSLYRLSMRNELRPEPVSPAPVGAISAETGTTAWAYEQRAATMSLAVTAEGFV